MSRRIRNRKRNSNKINVNMKVIIPFVILLLFILLFSVVFSLTHITSEKIVRGVKIGDVDVSNLTMEEAKSKLENFKNETLLKDIKIKYNDFYEIINVEELDLEMNIDKAVKDACLVGKSGNIFKDNYEILFSILFKKNIDCNITIDEEKVDKKIEELNQKLPNAFKESNYYIEEENLIITKGNKGIKIENEKFKEKLNETLNKEKREFSIDVKEIKPTQIDINKIQKEIYKEAQNAYISKNPTQVHPHINGIDFNISIEEINQILLEEKEEYLIPLKITIPEVTLADIGKEAFPNVLGSFTTTYNVSNENRTTNLELASEKIDGTIILPGEEFSYNKVVGARTIAKGYKEAAVYMNGKVVDGIGGGICQISSTLYNAVLYANLEVTSRTNHRFLTSYVEAGRDATVSYGTIDFCFKNNRTYPIKVVSTVKNGVSTIEIRGIREEKEYEIEIQNTIEEVIPQKVSYIKDSSLNEGEEQVKQYGSNGVKSVTYKIVKYNGAIVEKEVLSNDTYSQLEKVIIKGTKKTQETSSQIDKDEKEELLNNINPELLEMIKELE